MITKYHSLTGTQGRGVGPGYGGFRYESPLSTFVSRPQMAPAAETGDAVAKKVVKETPTVLDMVPRAPGEGTPRGVPSSVADYAPANDWEAAIDRAALGDPIGDFALDRAANVGLNLAAAKMVGVPSSFYGDVIKHSVAPPPATALGEIADLAVSGIAADQVKKSDYGKMLAGYDVAAHENVSDLGAEQYTPVPDDVDRFMAHQDALSEVRARTQPLTPSLSPPTLGQFANEFVVEPITRRPITTVFDEVVVPEKYRALLGADAGVGEGADVSDPMAGRPGIQGTDIAMDSPIGVGHFGSSDPRDLGRFTEREMRDMGFVEPSGPRALTVRDESDRWGGWADRDIAAGLARTGDVTRGATPSESARFGSRSDRDNDRGDRNGGRSGRGSDDGGRGFGGGGHGTAAGEGPGARGIW